MYLAHMLAPGGRRRARSATLIRRHTNHRRRQWAPWAVLIAAGLACAGGLVVLVGRPSGLAPIVGLPGGTNGPFVAGPIDDGPIPLVVRSEPSEARIVLDGRERGRTPLQLHTRSGSHTLLLNSDATLPAIQPVELDAHGATIDVALWGQHPSAARLRPAYPGAQLGDAEFLADGRLAVVVALSDRQPGQPATVAREGWAIEPVPGKGGGVSAGNGAEQLSLPVVVPHSTGAGA